MSLWIITIPHRQARKGLALHGDCRQEFETQTAKNNAILDAELARSEKPHVWWR